MVSFFGNESRVFHDVKKKKWEQLAQHLWPWKNIEDLKEQNGLTSMYSVEGPDKSPFSSKYALILIQRMHSIFLRVKVEAIAGGGDIPNERAVIHAENYREIISAIANEISKNPVGDIFDSAVFIGNILWGLVESLFLPPENRSVVADLVDWAHYTFGLPENEFNELEQRATFGANRIEEDDNFWEAVINQLLVGQFRSVISLLQLVSDYRTNTRYQRMIALLELFDYHQLHSDTSIPKFTHALNKVKENARYFNDHEALKFLCDLMMGDVTAFKKVSVTFNKPWYELLSGYIMFKMPLATVYNLSKLTKDLYDILGNRAQDGLISETILDLMNMEWIKALKDLASTKSLIWIAAHLFDLILKTDIAARTDEIEGLRDEVFVEFSKELFKTKNTMFLRPAVEYMMSTKDYKYTAVEPLLIIVAADDGLATTILIEEILTISKEYGFYEVYNQVTQAMAVNALKIGNWQGALAAACRNEGKNVMDMIAHFVIVNAPIHEIRNSIDLDPFESAINYSDLMLFLFHFNHYNKALNRSDIAECARLLHLMVLSNLAPQEFIGILFDNLSEVMRATLVTGSGKTLLNVEAILALQRCICLYQKQCEVRAVGSSKNAQQSESVVNSRMVNLYSVLTVAQALAAP